MSISRLAQRINASLSINQGGSLRIWGDWFGRPCDNCHRIVGASAESDHLKLTSDQSETLAVWNPHGVTFNARKFKVRIAHRVRWEWYYYGRPIAPENLYYGDYVLKGFRIIATTNVDWYVPDLRPSLLMPAVTIQICCWPIETSPAHPFAEPSTCLVSGCLGMCHAIAWQRCTVCL